MRYALILAALVTTALPAGSQTVSKSTADERRAMRYYEEGWKELGSNGYDAAAHDFTEAIGINPKDKLAYYGLGRAEMGRKRFAEAIRAYETSRDLYTEQAGANFTNLMEAERMPQQDQAQLQYAIQQLLRNNTSVNSAQIRQMRDQLQRIQTKRDTHKDASTVQDVPAFLSLALGSAYFRSGRLPEAERNFKLAIDADPNAGEAWNNLAVVYLVTSRFDEAERAVKTAEKVGYKVNESLKADIRAKRSET